MSKGYSDKKLAPDAMGPPPNEKTYPCKICERKFVKDSLGKHESACKILSKQRKPFESGKQRAAGSDVTLQGVKKAQKELMKYNGHFPPPKTSWRDRHENFVEAVSSARVVDHALKTGQPLPPPPKSTVPSDYVECEYCGRNFSQHAADRHIPFCKEQKGGKTVAGPKKALQPTGRATAPGQQAPPKTGNKTGGRAGASPSRAGRPSPSRAGKPSPSRAGKPSPSRIPSAPPKTAGGAAANKKSINGSAPPKTANSSTPGKKPATSRGRSPAGARKK